MLEKRTCAIYGAGLIQGLCLVAVPAASIIFMNPHDFNLSSAAYGGLFIPQALFSIAASFLNTRLTQRGDIKPAFLWGLFANLIAMALLALSALAMKEERLSYLLLLGVTSALGIGFGLTVPSLNTLTTLSFPKNSDKAVLILNALLGLGTALAPVLIAIFIGLGFWWGLPLTLSVAVSALFFFCFSLDFVKARGLNKKETTHRYPKKFWLFALFIFLYGIVETMNGTWSTVYMHKWMAASSGMASLALTAFWAAVTFGRVLFALIAPYFPNSLTYKVLPFLIATAALATVLLPHGEVSLGILFFGLAGLGCSALLPLTISFATEELPSISTSIAGSLIAVYLLGYGVAAFGVGSLEELAGIPLNRIFGVNCAMALIIGGLARVLTTGQARA